MAPPLTGLMLVVLAAGACAIVLIVVAPGAVRLLTRAVRRHR